MTSRLRRSLATLLLLISIGALLSGTAYAANPHDGGSGGGIRLSGNSK